MRAEDYYYRERGNFGKIYYRVDTEKQVAKNSG